MTASPAAGEPASTECIMVAPPTSGGNAMVHFVSTETPDIPVAPTVLQRSTQHAVETAVANIPFQRSNVSPQRAINHDLPAPLSPLDSDDHPPCSPSNLSPATPRPRIDLDAIERKIRRSLAEDFLHLPADDDPPQPSLWLVVLRKAALLPPPTPVDLDALAMKIQKSLQDDFCHLAAHPPAPVPSPHLTTMLPATTTSLPALIDPKVPSHPSNLIPTPPPPAAPPDVPIRVPPDPPTPNNLPDASCVAPIANNSLSVPQTLLPKLRRKPTPSHSAPPSKRARITSYFSPLPSGPVIPCPSTSLPPFNPVPMCTPDKYTQHNFRPP